MVKVDFLAGKFFLATFGQICVFGHPLAKNWILDDFSKLGLDKYGQRYPNLIFYGFYGKYSSRSSVMPNFMSFQAFFRIL